MFKIKEPYVRWIGIPLVAFLMTFIIGMDPGETRFHKFLSALVYTVVFWNGAFLMFMYFRKRFPKIRQTPQRLLITILCLSLFLLIGEPVIRLLLDDVTLIDLSDLGVLFQHTAQNFGAAFVIGLLYENVYFYEQWERTIQLNEALKNQQIRTQFEVLQNQMSPHFLFNSFNTLTTLIPEDQQVAVKFTEKLSEVYRYILQHKEKELVTVEEEIEFAKAYGFLLKMRYPQNLDIRFDLASKHLKQHIAPLTVQMLIENAIKHNVISSAAPLSIKVYVENGKSIVVKNNLQIKRTIPKSTKTGLSNIRKRYHYLSDRPIDIITTANNYLVCIPLIDLQPVLASNKI